MKHAHLKNYKIARIDFKNEVNGTVRLSFNSRVQHSVRYINDAICEAIMTVTVKDPKNPKSISITLVINGIFEFDKTINKEVIHVETRRELFSLAKTSIIAITSVAGIKPIIVNDIDFEKTPVLRYNPDEIRKSLGINKKKPPEFDDMQDGPDGTNDE